MQKRAESRVNKGLQRNELKIYRTVVLKNIKINKRDIDLYVIYPSQA